MDGRGLVAMLEAREERKRDDDSFFTFSVKSRRYNVYTHFVLLLS